ncbi:MFS transporter [Thermoproteota archaeon]
MQGIKENLSQFILHLIQVFFVGVVLGIERNIVPILAVDEFNVASISVIMAFIMSFGFVKALLNLYGGLLSDRWGRKRVLILGWLAALPIPLILIYAPVWEWVVIGNILLGVNQGLTWSMTITSQIDMSKSSERGMATGFNEFSGYSGVAFGTLVSAYISKVTSPRPLPFYFGLGIIVFALLLAVLLVKETRHYASQEVENLNDRILDLDRPYGFFKIMNLVDMNDTLIAISQAGHVEKYVDALVWVSFPLLFHRYNLTIVEIGMITSVYGFTWGFLQLITGPISDRVGRKWLITFGMWLCALGVFLTISISTGLSGWLASAFIIGVGMAFLYPTLLAAVSDVAVPERRGTTLGVYRFWRDSGYGIGALLIGVISDLFGFEWSFYGIAFLMFFSGIVVASRMDETLRT